MNEPKMNSEIEAAAKIDSIANYWIDKYMRREIEYTEALEGMALEALRTLRKLEEEFIRHIFRES